MHCTIWSFFFANQLQEKLLEVASLLIVCLFIIFSAARLEYCLDESIFNLNAFHVYAAKAITGSNIIHGCHWKETQKGKTHVWM